MHKCAHAGCNDESATNSPGDEGCQQAVDGTERVTPVAWLCFREEPKAITKVNTRYDILLLEALFLGRVKTGGRHTRKDVSLQVLAHWATVKTIILYV